MHGRVFLAYICICHQLKHNHFVLLPGHWHKPCCLYVSSQPDSRIYYIDPTEDPQGLGAGDKVLGQRTGVLTGFHSLY